MNQKSWNYRQQFYVIAILINSFLHSLLAFTWPSYFVLTLVVVSNFVLSYFIMIYESKSSVWQNYHGAAAGAQICVAMQCNSCTVIDDSLGHQFSWFSPHHWITFWPKYGHHYHSQSKSILLKNLKLVAECLENCWSEKSLHFWIGRLSNWRKWENGFPLSVTK